MRILLLFGLLALSGCGLFKPTYENCAETPRYAGARELPPLRVPEGVDAPDTRNAQKIPDVASAERPSDGRCVDAPPPYFPPQPGATG